MPRQKVQRVTPCLAISKSGNNANEDREFINRMNAFTQMTGLLSDDPFYEVL